MQDLIKFAHTIHGRAPRTKTEPGTPKPICSKLTLEQERRLVARRKEGAKLAELKAEFGVSISSAHNIIKHYERRAAA